MIKIGHNNPPLASKEIIEKNIERKKPILDRDPQFYNNIPIPSWIELSLIDVCNRSCSFCPKSDPQTAPNTFNKMELVLINKLAEDLKKIKFKGSLSFCGYGEPLLHPDINLIIEILGKDWGIEVVTNGDPLNEKNLLELYNSNLSKIVVSLYDGPEQKQKFLDLIKKLNISEEFIVLRDRWEKGSEFDIYLTNRAGTLSSSKQNDPKNFLNKECYYTAYHAQIDWNGDFYLCPHDWQRRMSLGNLMQKDFFEIWNGALLNKYRKSLLLGNRKINPCSSCNCIGTIHGSKHANEWIKILK
jgi:radical SAM protein with 4Fe4S-binding SPASM domain